MKPFPLRLLFISFLFGGLAACSTTETLPPEECSCKPQQTEPTAPPKVPDQPALVPSSFEELPGWEVEDHAGVLTHFVAQCSDQGNLLARRKRTPKGLLDFCRKTRRELTRNPDLPAQFWMESELAVWRLQGKEGEREGLLTGYYEPVFDGARKANGEFQSPLFGVPSDLISVDLGSLYPSLRGKRLRGRLQGQKLVPFFERESWEKIGPKREEPLVWLNDPLDAFLLQVQGSGRIRLQDDSVIRLSYANQNGHPYRSIGRVLVKRGELTVPQATIPGIRQWVADNPDKMNDLLNSNPSVVFFKENKVLNPEQGPVGAMGKPLVGELSIAIDKAGAPYGSLMWLSSPHPEDEGTLLAHAALAQDTGGAIRGRIRADYFWGTGKRAGELAGITRQPLSLWLLWPKDAPLPKIGSSR